MSQFVSPGATGLPVLAQADKRHADESFADNEDLFQPPPLLSFDWNSSAEARGFVSPWWPHKGCIFGGMGDGIDGDNLLFVGARHSDMWRSFGSNGRLSLVGVTRDAYGSPVGGCTVRLFRTSTDELQAKVTSDANGAFQISSPYGDAHYMTVHKTSTPDISGASVDTLIPA